MRATEAAGLVAKTFAENARLSSQEEAAAFECAVDFPDMLAEIERMQAELAASQARADDLQRALFARPAGHAAYVDALLTGATRAAVDEERSRADATTIGRVAGSAFKRAEEREGV